MPGTKFDKFYVEEMVKKYPKQESLDELVSRIKAIESKSAEEFINDILYQKHIFITPGTIFGSNGEGYIRFALCVKEEKIQEAIDRFSVVKR